MRNFLTFLFLFLIFSSPLHALDAAKIEQRIFDLVNAERARRRLPSYRFSQELASLARLHSWNTHGLRRSKQGLLLPENLCKLSSDQSDYSPMSRKRNLS